VRVRCIASVQNALTNVICTSQYSDSLSDVLSFGVGSSRYDFLAVSVPKRLAALPKLNMCADHTVYATSG
jgi:hypothetical protein